MEELEKQIKVVAEARQNVKEATEWRTSAYQRWLEANQVLLDNETNTKETCSEAEALLRELTLQAYAETGNKAPAEGVSVKIFEVLNYDSKEAMGWALEHRVALKLDTPTFEKIAKVDTPSFVTITEEARAQIARDLSLDK